VDSGERLIVTDYDSPWKEALDGYLPSFIALCFPVMDTEIDWSRGHEALDKELQQIAPDAEEGRKYVDKLVQVWRRTGEAEWVLIHIEVQGQEETAFAQRMFVYNSRLVERYNKTVVSLAVLADENPNWQPAVFRRELWGCSTEFRFPIVKLLGYAARAAELEASDNPFAWFILAHVKALETKRDDELRYRWKLRLIRNLFERGLTANEIRKLFRLIDWVITLPETLVQQFRNDVSLIQEEKHMPYVTSIERLAKEEGREIGLKRGIQVVLRTRFGEAGLRLLPEIEALHDCTLLDAILDRAEQVAAPEELRECWRLVESCRETSATPLSASSLTRPLPASGTWPSMKRCCIQRNMTAPRCGSISGARPHFRLVTFSRSPSVSSIQPAGRARLSAAQVAAARSSMIAN
jgi:hypothetical protein